MREFRDYLSQFPTDDTLFVDTTTNSFSAQKLIQKALSKQVRFAYWGPICSPQRFDFTFDSVFECGDPGSVSFDNWLFQEFLITSPEPPVETVKSGKPVHKENLKYQETQRASMYEEVSEGIMEFAKDAKRFSIQIDGEEVVRWTNNFLRHLGREDKRNLKRVFYPTTATHDNYIPLFGFKKEEL